MPCKPFHASKLFVSPFLQPIETKTKTIVVFLRTI